MCLVTECRSPNVASEDITVYKVLHKNLSSLHQFFYYELGKVYKVPELVARTVEPHTKVFVADEPAYLRYGGSDEWRLPDLIYISEGFHSYTNFNRAAQQCKSHDIYCIVECTVSVGSVYFLDTTGLMVSDSIRINGIAVGMQYMDTKSIFKWNKPKR